MFSPFSPTLLLMPSCYAHYRFIFHSTVFPPSAAGLCLQCFRSWLLWDFLCWVFFFFFLLLYVDCFLLNALNSSDAFIWKEIRSMRWPYVYKPVQPSPTKYTWEREFEENEISAGPRIWLLCSREGIKVIRTNNESQKLKRKEEGEWFPSFSRWRDKTTSYISIFGLLLFQF